MELMAAIMALETLTEPCSVVLHTDSQYVRQGITEWMPNWLRRNWKTAGGAAVKNRDLWERLHAATGSPKIDWRRTDVRRGGQECVSTCRSQWSQDHSKKK